MPASSTRPAPSGALSWTLCAFADGPAACRAGSAAALASWLDARAHGGRWLVRIEDLDPPREVEGAARDIVATLGAFGMESDESVLLQRSERGRLSGSVRSPRSRAVHLSMRLTAVTSNSRSRQAAFPAFIRDLSQWHRGPPASRLAPSRSTATINFVDRAAGPVPGAARTSTGDFIVRRADGLWAYQLAVVIDDAVQGITDVVRGADLLDNTARQIALQRALSLPTPRYLHVADLVIRSGRSFRSKLVHARSIAAMPAVNLSTRRDISGCRTSARMRSTGFCARRRRPWAERWLKLARGV